MKRISENAENINANFPKEWEVTRDLISFVDDKAYDLRKYGFSFITALIASEGVLLSLESTKGWPDEIKFAVLMINIILILGLVMLDRFFCVIQRAANTRARVLERTMNLELSEIITQRYRSAKNGTLITILNGLFVFVTMYIGVVTINSLLLKLLLVIAGFGIIPLILYLRSYIKVDYPFGMIDWTIDRLRCTAGDSIEITLTNLQEETLSFPASGDKPIVMWEARKEGESRAVSESGEIKTTLKIEPDDSYTWLWSTDGCRGVYRIFRRTLRQNELVPLARKIIVDEKPKSKNEPTLVKLVK